MEPSQNNNFGGNVGGNFDGFGMQNGTAGAQMNARINAPITSGTGDIVLPKEKNGSKKGLIIGLLIAVAVLVGGGIAALFLTQQNNDATLSPFLTLQYYIENGLGFDASTYGATNAETDDSTANEIETENVEGETEDAEDEETTLNESDLIYAVRVRNGSAEMIKDYYAGLRTRLENFAAGTNVDAEVLAGYTNNLLVLEGIINYEEMRQEVLGVLDEQGEEAARTYFAENVQCVEEGSLESICRLMNMYYERVISEYALYVNAGCYNDGVYEMQCAIDYYGEEKYMADSEQSGMAEMLLGRLQIDGAIETLSGAVFMANAEMAEML